MQTQCSAARVAGAAGDTRLGRLSRLTAEAALLRRHSRLICRLAAPAALLRPAEQRDEHKLGEDRPADAREDVLDRRPD